DSLVRTVDIRRIKCESVWIFRCYYSLSVGIELYIFIKRIIRARNNKGVTLIGSPIQKVLYSTVNLQLPVKCFGKLDILNTPPGRIFFAWIEFTKQRQSHRAI